MQAPKSQVGRGEMAWLMKMSRVLPPFLKELDSCYKELQDSNKQAVSPPTTTPTLPTSHPELHKCEGHRSIREQLRTAKCCSRHCSGRHCTVHDPCVCSNLRFAQFLPGITCLV